MSVRTRVAPSPTGDPHVGTAYIALFSLCMARKLGGQFVLRIEDTDRARSSERSERAIMDSLRWLGIDWDEGPDKGGPHGPYRQSERRELYVEHAGRLVTEGHAFRCFCSAERLSQLRAQQLEAKGKVGYDGHCLALAPAEAEARAAAGEPHVIRMRVPEAGQCAIDDQLRGKVEIAWDQVDMQVLLKADGMPTYHLAVVVDDHLMGITDVFRGEEWITSTPKHLLLYQYFGWEPPRYFHLPLLRNPDKSKLSKRKNPTSITFYERMGFMPEALLNYLGMMGWSMPDGEEKFSLDQMIEHFEPARVSLGGPVFDMEKLSWLNGRWIREELDPEGFARRMQTWALNASYLMPIIPLIQQRVERFSDVVGLTGHFLTGLPSLSEASFAHKKHSPEDIKKTLQFVVWRLDAHDDWRAEPLKQTLTGLAEGMGIGVRDMLFPVFVSISGQPVSTPMYETLEILGPDLSRARLRHGLAALGGVSKKQAKRLEKQYRELQT
ncbi:MAG: glutamate--tRNA ligase [Myxococcales bacterium]|nr:glutamate--tRNA ligase [Myxococcales bacterium]MDD9971405.1 glutamate--tRNA ligase [Myxococcales bacterium]